MVLSSGVALLAQSRTAGTTTTTGSPGGNPQLTSGTGKYANFDQVMGHQHGSITLTGNVVTPNGQLPWDPVPVVVTCNGKTSYNTLADPQGHFSIEAAPRQSEIAPQPGAKGVNPTELFGCNVQATLQGYQSSVLNIANRNLGDNPDVGTIRLDIDERAKGFATSPTTASAPKEARKDFDRARQAANENHPDKARDLLQKAVKEDQQFAEAWYQLGKLQEAQQPQEAYKSFSNAAAADPQYSPVYEHLALAAAQQKDWQHTLEASNHALQIDPAGTPQIWYYSALGNFNSGHKEEGEKAARASLAMDPSHVAPNTEQLLAVMLASRGAYPEALDHLRNCLTYTQPGPNADLVKQQIAQLEKMQAESKK